MTPHPSRCELRRQWWGQKPKPMHSKTAQWWGQKPKPMHSKTAPTGSNPSQWTLETGPTQPPFTADVGDRPHTGSVHSGRWRQAPHSPRSQWTLETGPTQPPFTADVGDRPHTGPVQLSSVQFNSIQDGIYALGKAHICAPQPPVGKESNFVSRPR